MRRIFQGSFKDQNGNVVGGGTVTVYLAGTSTLATIYAAASGGSAISTSSVTSSSTAATLGYFQFYVDEADYASSQLFKISLSKAGYTTNDYDNIAMLFQLYDAGLESIAGLTTAADKLIYTTASDTYAVTDYTASARSFDALNVTANKFAYGNGSSTYALADVTAAGLALLDDANAAAQLVTLGALAKAGDTSTGHMNFSAGATTLGTTTNDDAAAGYVGEYTEEILLQASAISLTTATPVSILAKVLSPGDWDVDGLISFLPAATTSVIGFTGGISLVNDTLPTEENRFSLTWAAQVPGAYRSGFAVPTVRVKVATGTTTSVYGVAQATFSVSTMTAFGKLRFRRIR